MGLTGFQQAFLLLGLGLMGITPAALGPTTRLGLSTTQYQGDASQTINEGIKDAIRHGRHEFDLPAGTIQISQPIVIPPGTRDFTLAGAGSGSTKIVNTLGALKWPVQVGQFVELHNNWGLVNVSPGTLVEPVATGDKVVHLDSGAGVRPGDYAVLWDLNMITSGGIAGGTHPALYNRGELTRITGVDGGSVQLDVGAAREYEAAPHLSPCSRIVCTNITVKGLTVDGMEPDGKMALSCIRFGMVDGLNVEDVQAFNFGVYAIQTNLVRNATFTNDLVAGGGDKIGQPGNGYGFTLCRSRLINFSNCKAENTRHAFCCHTGTTDVNFVNCVAPPLPHSINDFNTHGFDERRIHFDHCTGHIDIGNPAWMAGAEGCVVTKCDSSDGIYFGPNTRNCVVQDSLLGQVELSSNELEGGSPAGGMPADIKFEDCQVKGNPVIAIKRAIGKILFDDCLIEQTNQSWGVALRVMPGTEGSLEFTNCQIVNDSSRPGDSLVTVDASPELNLSFSGCKFKSLAGSSLAVDVKSGTTNLRLVNNDFFSSHPRGRMEIVNVEGAANQGNRIHQEQ